MACSTYAQRLRLDVVRLPPEKTRGRHGLVRFAPVRHGRPAGHGRGVDDGHGVGGQELVAALVGVAERGGKLRGSVEPEDPDRDSAGRFVAADLEDVGGPEGGVGEVVAGGGDDVVHAVAFVFDWVDVGGEGVREGGRAGWYVLITSLKRRRLSQIAVGRTM